MTPKYWARIAAGILIIFVVGMFVVRGVNHAKDMVLNGLPGSLPLLATGFRVDGKAMGDVQRLQLMRSRPGLVDSAVVTVKLKPGADASRIDGCALEVVQAEPFGGGTHFTCMSSADSSQADLVAFGHVEVLPEGTQVPLFVARNRQDEMQRRAYRGAGSRDSGDVDIRAQNDTFTVTINGRELVHIYGGSNGGSLVIRGANGKPIVEIGGDSNGGSVKITDANGRTRVDIHGTNSGRDSAKP